MAAKSIKAGEAYVQMFLDTSALRRQLRNASRRLQQFGAGVRRIGTALTGASAAILGPLALATRQFVKMGDEVEKMSRRTGIGAEALSELGFAAEQSGTDLATVEKGVRTMQRAINDLGRGLSTQTDAFGKLGISLQDIQGLSPEDQFTAIAEALSGVEDATTRAAVAQQIFGRAGTQLLPLFENGAAGMNELREEARRLGITIDGSQAQQAAALADAFNRVARVAKAVAFQVGAALAPVVEDVAERITEIVAAIIRWVKENGALIRLVAKVAAIVGAAGVALVALGTAISAAGVALGLLASVIGLVLSPLGATIAAVTTLGVMLGRAIIQTDQWADALGSAREALGGIADAIKANDIGLAWEIMVTGMELAWAELTRTLKQQWIEVNRFIVDRVFDALQEVDALLKKISEDFGIGFDVAAAREAMGQDFDSQIKAITLRIERLTSELGELNAEAERGAREAAADSSLQSTDPGGGLGRTPLGPPRLTARGRFNVAGGNLLALQGAGVGPLDDIANNTEESAETLRRLLDVTRRRGRLSP